MKIMKLTSMKSFAFLSGLKHIHKSDVHGPSPRNHFLANKVALTTGPGEASQSCGAMVVISTALLVALAGG